MLPIHLFARTFISAFTTLWINQRTFHTFSHCLDVNFFYINSGLFSEGTGEPRILYILLTKVLPIVYTFGISNHAVINLKTDPELKKKAIKVANKLGVSVSAVLNNELRRFATEQSVIFEVPEVPNEQTAKQMANSKKQIEKGDYHQFNDNKESLEFFADELK